MELSLERTSRLYGEEGVKKLNDSHVAVFGLGGVGCYAVEALARAGIMELTVVDNDFYEQTNLNRQLYATVDTLGVKKTIATKDRINKINPKIKVNVIDKLILESNACEVDFSKFDYVIDAIDNVSGKIGIIIKCKEENVPVISVMGTGNKVDPTAFRVDDIKNTKVCPLAKVVRKLLKEKNVSGVKVVYSQEEPKKSGSNVPSSNSFVPAVAGLIASGKVINDLISGVKDE